ncbi:hypothetical protein AVEN_217268-1 [Araneus ventricosus]|uniref:Uncharacterized protein n=1 Tax=Araneus ventricosus TaxID=182803 RepID=A0A4Y2PMR6_ARAVE|nr:hypothetical protein AVEN_217268-1 [Araneus ventricosus]
MTDSSHVWIPDLGDKLGDHLGGDKFCDFGDEILDLKGIVDAVERLADLAAISAFSLPSIPSEHLLPKKQPPAKFQISSPSGLADFVMTESVSHDINPWGLLLLIAQNLEDIKVSNKRNITLLRHAFFSPPCLVRRSLFGTEELIGGNSWVLLWWFNNYRDIHHLVSQGLERDFLISPDLLPVHIVALYSPICFLKGKATKLHNKKRKLEYVFSERDEE